MSASRNGGRLEFDPARLINDTSEWLKRFSRQTDRLAVFRRVTLYGLLVGFPILLYVLIYAGWRALTSRILTDNSSRLASSALCLTMGIMLLLPMLEAGSEDMTPETLASNLASGAWPKRVAALRYIERRKIDIAAYPQYRSLVDSPRVVERYWLARSMAASRAPSTMPHLTALTRDPHPNVVCQAYFALGRRKMPRAIQTIRRQMQTSDHWYTQWYGYRAMRSLGWQQRPSK